MGRGTQSPSPHSPRGFEAVEKDYVDDSKSILAEIKGKDIDITSDSDNDELEIL